MIIKRRKIARLTEYNYPYQRRLLPILKNDGSSEDQVGYKPIVVRRLADMCLAAKCVAVALWPDDLAYHNHNAKIATQHIKRDLSVDGFERAVEFFDGAYLFAIYADDNVAGAQAILPGGALCLHVLDEIFVAFDV